MESEPDQGSPSEGRNAPAGMPSSETTRGTGTTIAIGCVILFIVLTIALAFVAQQFR